MRFWSCSQNPERHPFKVIAALECIWMTHDIIDGDPLCRLLPSQYVTRGPLLRVLSSEYVTASPVLYPYM